jgi:membrane protease YdiL (CAAX protease family)
MKRDLAVLAFALAFPTLAAWGYFVAARTDGDGVNRLGQALYTASKVVQFSLPVVYLWFADRVRLRPAKPTAAGLGLGAGFGVIVVGLLWVNYATWFRELGLATDMASRLRAKVAEFGIRTPAQFSVLALFVAVPHSFLEEYYWRWFVHGGLRRHLPATAAGALSSLGFMGHHVVILNAYLPGRFWEVTLPLSLAIAAGGAVWAWLYDRTRSVYGPWASHLLVDAGVMVVGYDLIFQVGARG